MGKNQPEIVDTINDVPLFKYPNTVKWISYTAGIVITLFILSALSGCSPQQRLQHLENRHPELFKPVKDSSLRTFIRWIKRDTVITVPKESDTTLFIDGFNQSVIHDTTIVRKFINGSTIIQIKHDTIEAICNESAYKDTIKYKNETIDSLKTIVNQGLVQDIQYKTHWWDYFCRGLSLLIIIILIILLIVKEIQSKV